MYNIWVYLFSFFREYLFTRLVAQRQRTDNKTGYNGITMMNRGERDRKNCTFLIIQFWFDLIKVKIYSIHHDAQYFIDSPQTYESAGTATVMCSRLRSEIRMEWWKLLIYGTGARAINRSKRVSMYTYLWGDYEWLWVLCFNLI